MQSNSYHNRQGHVPNIELYQEVFRVLDDLGMADLKWTFQEHCIQVNKKYDCDNNHMLVIIDISSDTLRMVAFH